MNRFEDDDELNLEPLNFQEVDDDYDDEEDDDDDDSFDENAHLKQIRPGAQESSIRRNDSFVSFMTRSERNAILGKDKPPSKEEAEKRSVKFKIEPYLETVHLVEQVDDSEKDNVWLTNKDFDRQETEIKMTQFRWENHKEGKIPFDESKNTVRGLEHLFDQQETSKWKHARAVLEEINRQKLKFGGKVVDWTKVRQVSEQFSGESMKQAAAMGKADEEAYRQAWDPSLSPITEKEEDNTKKKKKKKSSFLFWKKWGL